jgi:alpha-L-rhamnosidase
MPSSSHKIFKPYGLLCEYIVDPIGIDVKIPRFSWILHHMERGVSQSAYQIQVASNKERLSCNTGDIWDSGEVRSKESVNVPFDGSPLEACRKYYWRVRWWDQLSHQSQYSETATFETGLFQESDWRAEWIEGKDLFRKQITVNKIIESARVYVSGLGFYELNVNGKRIGNHVLDPGWTSYDKLVLYSTYDITQDLVSGENVIGVMLGNGRYAQKPSENLPPYMIEFIELYGRPNKILLIQIQVKYTDGSDELIVSDRSWKTENGPIVYDDLCNGEIYDARHEKTGWTKQGFDDNGWLDVSLAEPPRGKLVSQTSLPPIRRIKTIQPIQMSNPEPGVYVYDLGQNFAGWVRLKVQGPRGSRVSLRFAELLNNDGALNVVPNRSARAEDVYILKGGRVEVYEPKFTYHGFRYVEVKGYPGTPNLESVEGVVVNSDVRTTGGFSCSNKLINTIHRNIVWGQLSNLMSIPTDCPQRDERLGWTGDAQLTIEEIFYNFDAAAFFTKWVRDIREAQREDGAIPNFVPSTDNSYISDPAWGIAGVIVPWYLYLHYRDRRILEENYEMMRKWVEFLESNSVKHLTKLTRYGDWCPPGQIKSLDTSGELVSTWYHFYGAMLLHKVEGILGMTNRVDRTLELVESIKDAFNNEFLKTKFYDRGSQTSNILPLFLDMVPEQALKSVLGHLIEEIEENRGGHLATGIVGTRYILDTLTKHGYSELAYRIVTNTTYPSWGYMIKEGATTLWERWEYLASGGMNSHNHIMLGSIDSWFYKTLAGIRVDANHPGFNQIIIKPHPVGDLSHVSASIETPLGKVSSSWKIEDRDFFIEVSIPVNSQGTLHIPNMEIKHPVIMESNETIWRDESFVEGVPGIQRGEQTKGYTVFLVGSGRYSFRLTGAYM